MNPILIAADLDGTLAPSKEQLPDTTGQIIQQLLQRHHFAIISGASWKQFTEQCISHIPEHYPHEHLHILPTNGAMYLRRATDAQKWETVWDESFTDDEFIEIKKRIAVAVEQSNIEPILQTWGDQIENRGGQITWSALGQNAPLVAKSIWDTDRFKRHLIQKHLAPLLGSDFEIRVGGLTSIDITRAGTNKASGIKKLCVQLNLQPQDVLYIGDALEPGGNDASIREAGFPTRPTSGPDETREILKQFVG